MSEGEEPALVIREGEEKGVIRGGEATVLHKFSITSGFSEQVYYHALTSTSTSSPGRRAIKF